MGWTLVAAEAALGFLWPIEPSTLNSQPSTLNPEPSMPPDLNQLGELRIGPLRLDFPVVQAALSGYSDRPMRLIARRLGAPYTLCEVMLDQFIVEREAAAAATATSCTSPTKSIPSAGSSWAPSPSSSARPRCGWSSAAST